MSISDSQLEDFCRVINNHPALAEVKRRIKMKIFNRFITATDQDRVVLGNLMGAGELFYKEFSIVVNEMASKNIVNIND